MNVFEYAVLRVVPRVERGELHQRRRARSTASRAATCARGCTLDAARLRALDPAVDLAGVRPALAAVRARLRRRGAGRLRGEPLGGRFRWLTAPRSTIVQPGPVHAGLTADPAAELDHLLTRLVRPAQAGLSA